jgi:hypothetical protein
MAPNVEFVALAITKIDAKRYTGKVTFRCGLGPVEDRVQFDYVHPFKDAVSVEEAIRCGAGALEAELCELKRQAEHYRKWSEKLIP